jgi:hypothetical protein
MYTAPSSRFIPALAYSHRVVTEAQLLRTDGTIEALDHTGGTVTVDRGQAVRRTCTVTLADTSLIPRTPADKLSVYGAQLRIRRGIDYGDGSAPDLVPLGVFRIDDVQGDPDTGPVTITGSGLESFVIDDVFKAPVTLTSGSAVAGITTLIQGTIPTATVISRATDATVGTMSWDREASRWDACTTLATALGAELYADAAGQFIIAPLPDLDPTSVVWEVAAGEGGVLVSATRGMARAGVFNSVTAYGENTADNVAPVSATVEDTDPTSPTYVSGPFGRVPTFYSSASLITTAQCTAAATQMLKTRLKPNAVADVTSLPNPLLEPGDVIRVVYLDGSREIHQVASFSIDLTTGGDFVLATISAQEDS